MCGYPTPKLANTVAILLHGYWAIYGPPRRPFGYAIHLALLVITLSCKGPGYSQDAKTNRSRRRLVLGDVRTQEKACSSDSRFRPQTLWLGRTRPMLPHTTSAVSAFPEDDVRPTQIGSKTGVGTTGLLLCSNGDDQARRPTQTESRGHIPEAGPIPQHRNTTILDSREREGYSG